MQINDYIEKKEKILYASCNPSKEKGQAEDDINRNSNRKDGYEEVQSIRRFGP